MPCGSGGESDAPPHPELEILRARPDRICEESFFRRVERERQEEKEREAAEEHTDRERERKEARERHARERREMRESKEWAIKPTVTERMARKRGLSLLHKQVPTWTYRTYGSLQCAGGKISRSQWRCRVIWIAGSRCHTGRIRIIGAGRLNHQAIYRSKIEYGNGYGYVHRGRIGCYVTKET